MEIKTDCPGINWTELKNLLNEGGMHTYSEEMHKKAFENSQKVVFLVDKGILAGAARIISDNSYQAAVYDVVIKKDYRGKGFGSMLMEELLKGTENMNVILYSSPGKENFYRKCGFKSGKTCMIKTPYSSEMKEKGILSE